ncbi:glycosyl transferase family protein [Caballeronia fortuita]|uniref:Glycosyl transferase family protein n=1 Tax=Caballeronia fortuita TaxID=1777138 RepID=A0A158AQS8_9BURK|nr:glycosyltransferase [Caballeronia fortuita]SAK59397.1 glycosyl transferase family protein [Caballeronia fortuita]
MLNLALGFISSFCMTLLIVRFAGRYGALSLDHDLNGVQKNHSHPVPRIGGIALMVAACVTFPIAAIFGGNPRDESFLLLLCALPAFGSGVIEDLTKRVSVRARLLSAMFAALLGAFILHGVIGRVDLPLVDPILSVAPIAIGLTVLAVAGLTNAVNIIDGFNGLAAVVAILIFGSIGYVAHEVGDLLVMSTALTMIGAIGGFAIWNYPAASIFLGDGGAYFIGFTIAELLVLLVARHPNVCAWYAMVVAIYPLFETLFSIYRRRIVRGRPVGAPDGIHLHTLIFKRIVRKGSDPRQRQRRNARTSPYLWVLSMIGIVPASLFWHNPVVLAVTAVVFAVAYVWLYTAIVRFKTPRWLVGTQRRSVVAAAVPEQTTHHK